jgi:hypothetical protein
MEAILGFTAGVGGLAVTVLLAAFVIGWLLLRRSARKLKGTT